MVIAGRRYSTVGGCRFLDLPRLNGGPGGVWEVEGQREKREREVEGQREKREREREGKGRDRGWGVDRGGYSEILQCLGSRIAGESG
jgi:hypothetical protein